VANHSKSWAVHRHRALSLVVLALVVFLSPRAHAVAPMCDPSAASVPAPVPAPPNATGDLVAPKTCDDPSLAFFDASRPAQDSPPPDWRSSPPDRVLPTAFGWGEPSAALAACPPKVLAPDRPGYAPPVYRPPCS
jgi:hypothetical protein